MGLGGRLCLCLLFAFALMASARNTISIRGNGVMMMPTEGRRSLKAVLDDYNDPTANRGHDPPSSRNRSGGGNGNGGGHRV